MRYGDVHGAHDAIAVDRGSRPAASVRHVLWPKNVRPSVRR